MSGWGIVDSYENGTASPRQLGGGPESVKGKKERPIKKPGKTKVKARAKNNQVPRTSVKRALGSLLLAGIGKKKKLRGKQPRYKEQQEKPKTSS